jgi:hypothetical protein
VKVDGNRLKLVAAGSANIILSFKGDDDYQSSKTSYKLTVVAGWRLKREGERAVCG